jgi:excisionase family DNA binding protein
MITIREICREFNVSRSTVKRLIKQGKLQPVFDIRKYSKLTANEQQRIKTDLNVHLSRKIFW